MPSLIENTPRLPSYHHHHHHPLTPHPTSVCRDVICGALQVPTTSMVVPADARTIEEGDAGGADAAGGPAGSSHDSGGAAAPPGQVSAASAGGRAEKGGAAGALVAGGSGSGSDSGDSAADARGSPSTPGSSSSSSSSSDSSSSSSGDSSSSEDDDDDDGTTDYIDLADGAAGRRHRARKRRRAAQNAGPNAVRQKLDGGAGLRPGGSGTPIVAGASLTSPAYAGGVGVGGLVAALQQRGGLVGAGNNKFTLPPLPPAATHGPAADSGMDYFAGPGAPSSPRSTSSSSSSSSDDDDDGLGPPFEPDNLNHMGGFSTPDTGEMAGSAGFQQAAGNRASEADFLGLPQEPDIVNVRALAEALPTAARNLRNRLIQFLVRDVRAGVGQRRVGARWVCGARQCFWCVAPLLTVFNPPSSTPHLPSTAERLLLAPHAGRVRRGGGLGGRRVAGALLCHRRAAVPAQRLQPV